MADITAIVNTNTFDEQMATINEIITKLNTIEANASTMLLAFSSAGEPLDALVTTNTAMLFTDSSGNFKIKRNIADTITVHTITISAAE
tara:strand:- start:233 stop:499 length:267 start_codon:yes stop_codon:yes gene_type:complete